jgi:hypothetical protein
MKPNLAMTRRVVIASSVVLYLMNAMARGIKPIPKAGSSTMPSAIYPHSDHRLTWPT